MTGGCRTGPEPVRAAGGPLDDRAVAAALAGLVLVLALADVRLVPDGALGLLDGPVATAVGVLAAFAQAALVLWSSERPRVVFGLLAALAAVQFALITVAPGYVWGVLAYAVARGPGRAFGWIIAAASGSLAATTAWILVRAPAPEAAVTEALVLLTTVTGGTVYIVIGVAAGRLARRGADRLADRRLAGDRVRRAAALADERSRIAAEVGGGVLTGLRRLVERVDALAARRDSAGDPDPDIREEVRGVREHARSVLASMRRVVQALRAEPAEPGPPSVPAPGTGPATPRWWPPRAPDRLGILAVGVVAAGVLLGDLAAGSVPPGERFGQLLGVSWGRPASVLALSVQVGALAWWRTAPVAAVVVTAVATAASALLGAGNAVADLAWLLAVWGVASRVPPRWSGPAVVLGSVVVLAGASRSGTLLGSLPDGILAAALVFAPVPVLWLAGTLVLQHRTGLAELRSRAARDGDRRSVAEERMRVARDLHDVVAHHVSAVAVQAGAAQVATGGDAVRQALGHMAESARRIEAALPELEHLTPVAAGLVLDGAGVAQLVEPSRRAGLPVTVETCGRAADPPDDADLFAQRVLVEALTNVLRHAGPAPTRVRVRHEPEAVVVSVEDAGPVPEHRAPTTGSGLGLVGMGERVALLGGSLQAGPQAGGWRVRVALTRPAAG